MKIRLTPQDLRGRLIGTRPAYGKYEKRSNGTIVADLDEIER